MKSRKYASDGTMPLPIILQYVTVLNRVVCCLLYGPICTWTSSYHSSDIWVWVAIFTGVCIYADDITLLAPSRASLVLMLVK